jgi:DNA-binding transcriptional LysR family regulator
MRDVHLRDVDLNLLRTIQPLLEERHISRAAKRAFLSQPAMSRALNRLRDTFGDPLLVRSNGAYERTPRGERVLREIESIMRRLNAIVHDQEFTPAQSRERFRVAMTDHGSTILLPKLLLRLRKEAAHSELMLSAVGPQTFDDVGAGRIDLNICAAPLGFATCALAQRRLLVEAILRWAPPSFPHGATFLSPTSRLV